MLIHSNFSMPMAVHLLRPPLCFTVVFPARPSKTSLLKELPLVACQGLFQFHLVVMVGGASSACVALCATIHTHFITDKSGENTNQTGIIMARAECVCVRSCSSCWFFCVFYYYLNVTCMGDVSDSLLGVVAAQPRFADVSGRKTSSTHTHTRSKAQLSLSLFHTQEGGALGWARMQVTRAFDLPRAAFAELFLLALPLSLQILYGFLLLFEYSKQRAFSSCFILFFYV